MPEGVGISILPHASVRPPRPCMKSLSVRSDVCHRLPPDSTSRWTPLPWAIAFPLLGRFGDLHPLDNAQASSLSASGFPATAQEETVTTTISSRLLLDGIIR